MSDDRSDHRRVEPGPPPPAANQAKEEPIPASREESGDPGPGELDEDPRPADS